MQLECMQSHDFPKGGFNELVRDSGYAFPQVGMIYSVRDISSTLGVLLNEIHNPKIEWNNKLVEGCFCRDYFWEVSCPQDIIDMRIAARTYVMLKYHNESLFQTSKLCAKLFGGDSSTYLYMINALEFAGLIKLEDSSAYRILLSQMDRPKLEYT